MANHDFAYAYDLTLDEARRRSAVLEAIGNAWDPIAALADEQTAYDICCTRIRSAPPCCPHGRPIVLPIDPTADRSRRAWLPCPCCDHGAKCADCRDTRN